MDSESQQWPHLRPADLSIGHPLNERANHVFKNIKLIKCL